MNVGEYKMNAALLLSNNSLFVIQKQFVWCCLEIYIYDAYDYKRGRQVYVRG